ncbi:MAG TPA: glutathione S-transferase family protein [Polyangiaceae bacterium]|nr:glutathione S-transferase family protein [Polyangiaceae bacterium]
MTTSTTISPQAVRVSVLAWAPPMVHGLVRDLRVRWALEEAGWPYHESVVNRAEQASAKYRELQPFGQIPAMECGDLKLFESGAIVHYIAERSPALMPEDAAARSQVTAWMFGALNTVEPPVMMLSILDMIYQGPKGDDYRGIRAWVAGWVESRLDVLAGVLEGKEYVLGRFSAADVLLTTVLRVLRDTDFVKKRAVLEVYQRRCEARPAFQKALKDHLENFARHAPTNV